MIQKLIMERVFGNEYGNIFDASGSLIGNFKGLTFGKKHGPGRPNIPNGKLIAGYLAYWLGCDAGMKDIEARKFAIDTTKYGVGAQQNKMTSFKKRLESEKTITLVKNKTRITVQDESDPPLAASMLLEEGFENFVKEGQLYIKGNGWLWRPSMDTATLGTVSYTSPKNFEYSTVD